MTTRGASMKNISKRQILREVFTIEQAVSNLILRMQNIEGVFNSYVEMQRHGEKLTKYLKEQAEKAKKEAEKNGDDEGNSGKGSGESKED